MNDSQFRQQLSEHGYGDAYTVEFEPNRSGGSLHTHDFSAMVMVTRGTLTLDYETGPVSYGPGQWCEVPAGTLHAERTGPDGASALAGKK